MNRLHYALLAGSALMALSAAGCASNTSKPAAQQPAASGSSAGATTASVTSSASGGSSGTASSTASSSASSTASSTSVKSSSSPSGKSSSKPSSAPGQPPVCDNAKLDASLAARVAGQKASVYVIAVKNTGPACDLAYLPYVWITAGPSGGPEQARPLIPGGLGGGPKIIKTGETQYAGIDLNPDSAANAVDGYTYLSVTPSPTVDSSGKDVQDLRLPAPAKVAKAKLGLYVADVATAIDQIKYANTPEQ